MPKSTRPVKRAPGRKPYLVVAVIVCIALIVWYALPDTRRAPVGATCESNHACRSGITIGLVLMFASLVFCIQATDSAAHTFDEEEFTCPLCGTKFKAIVDCSGTVLDRRLDLKPLGAIAAPWRKPVCPACHFVLYSEQEKPAEDIGKLRKIVGSEEYKKLVREGHTSYFLWGAIREKTGADHFDTGWTFLQASWQVARVRQPGRVRKDDPSIQDRKDTYQTLQRDFQMSRRSTGTTFSRRSTGSTRSQPDIRGCLPGKPKANQRKSRGSSPACPLLPRPGFARCSVSC